MELSPAVQSVKPSITLAISARAKAMKAEGIDVIPLSAGEPDFDTPRHICDAAIEAINGGFTRYTPASGTAELKKAVADTFRADNGLDYDPSQVIINCGAKHSVFLAVFVMVRPGEEVIVPAPYWVSYPEMVRLAGGTPVIVETTGEKDYKLTPDLLRGAITDRTKLLILNSPSNPTGMVYSGDELAAIGEVVSETGIYVLSDEIYQKLIYGGVGHVSFASLSDDLFGRTVTVNGVSKTYCMTGWRIGWTAGPKEIITAMGTMQSQETSNPCSIAQKAALAALTGPQDFLPGQRAAFDERRKYVVDRLNTMDGVSCIEPQGAFYAFPDVSGVYGRSWSGGTIDGSVALCDYLLSVRHIALVPGAGFGADANVRLSYAASLEQLGAALDRLEAGIAALS